MSECRAPFEPAAIFSLYIVEMAGYTFSSSRTDSILDLPDDLLFSVCQFLPLTDLVNMRQVRFFLQTPHRHDCAMLQASQYNSATCCNNHVSSLPSTRSAPYSGMWWTRPDTSRFGLALPLPTSGRTRRALTA